MTIDPNPTPASEAPEVETPAAVASDETPATSVAADPVPPTADPVVADAAPSTEVPVETPSAEAPIEPAPEAVVPAPSPEPAPVTESAPEAPVAEVAPAVETDEAPAPPAGVQVASDADLFDQYFSAPTGESTAFDRPQKGKRYEATVIQVQDDKVFVSLGAGKTEGIVPLAELSEQSLTTAKGAVKEGDKIDVVVVRTDGDGNPIVSKKRADFERVWDDIEKAHETGVMLNAQVVERVKGGLVVDIGVRGFVPATHVGNGKLRNIEKYLGQELQLKVIEIDRERKKVVLSNREAEEERRAAAKEDIFGKVKPGEVLEGTVRRLTDYGAFVDLGGVDGLLHISEMGWARITHPKEMFKEGQKIKVMVLRLDPANGKISLGHRQVLEDPWTKIRENYKNGQKLTVVVNRIVQSGAFIRLPEGAEAFMPVSEMSIRRIRRPQDVVDEGETVECQIIDLRTEDRRMVLSMRAIGGGAELKPGATEAPFDFDRSGSRPGGGGRTAGPRRDGGYEEFTSSRRGVATGGATIGERLGALKGLLGGGGKSDDETSEDEG